MNTKDNRRARLTKLLLKQAYMELMRQKHPGKITVKDICERADVNRSTFYIHYSEPNDILIEAEDETIALVKDALCVIGSIDGASRDAMENLSAFLHYVRKNEELFRTFLVENNDLHFRSKLTDFALHMTEEYFDLDLDPERRHLASLFIVSGSLEILTFWIRSDFSISEKTICEMLYRLSEGGLYSIISRGRSE